MTGPPYSTRRYLQGALCFAAAGIWIGYEGIKSMRAGIAISGGSWYNHYLEDWEAVGIGGFLVFLAIVCAGVGWGFIKPKPPG